MHDISEIHPIYIHLTSFDTSYFIQKPENRSKKAVKKLFTNFVATDVKKRN